MKKRVISAIIALLIVVPLVYFGGKPYIIGVGILSVLCLKEVFDLKVSHKEIPNIVKILSIVCMLLLVYSEFDGYSLMYGLTYRGLAITMLSLLIPTLFYKNEKYTTKDAFFLIGSVIFLGLFFNGLILVRIIDIKLFIYLILIATMTDTFAYIVGSLIGRNKIVPRISPGKTWEGSIGGSLLGSFIAISYYSIAISSISFKLLVITVVLSIIGQLGDLLFSKIKRENKIKDFSNIMPGHGGILDRLDSISFIVLSYLIIYSLI
ncbi:MAG: phosphatidate cytidylyltransferase [Bacilli bacterium]|nr:phosphatidate cytidylyltransferase [Bacilli bacterium]